MADPKQNALALDPEQPAANPADPADPEYVKPSPAENPRNISMREIASKVALQHAADEKEDNNVPSIDEDGNVTPAPGAAPAQTSTAPAPEAAAEGALPAEAAEPTAVEPSTPAPAPDAPEPLDPTKMYDVVVHGQKMQVPGKSIIEAGIATLQKGAEADFRLKVASQLLEEAERRSASTTAQGDVTKPSEPLQKGSKTGAELAQMLQFGTPEQAEEAAGILLSRGQTPEQIATLTAEAARTAARDEIEFQRAKGFLQREYSDVLAKEPLRNLFFSEEQRLRQAGDKRPYAELYKAIGETMRKDFNLPKPSTSVVADPSKTPLPGSAAARQSVKAATPSVPRTAAARLEGAAADKPKTPSEIIAGMAAQRGKSQLTQQRR